MAHVVHISSVHNADDPRIRRKQLTSISREGWKATLVTGNSNAKDGDGVSIVRVPTGNRNRLVRILITAPLAILMALRISADIYHIHDPELLLWSWLLKLRGKPVVYDIHEDLTTSVSQKRWLPTWISHITGATFGELERLGSVYCYRIIAEKYYNKRYPEAIQILNYPTVEIRDMKSGFSPHSTKVLYTGNVTVNRGAIQMARLAAARPDLEIVVVGRCDSDLARELKAIAGIHGRLTIIGEGYFVPHDEIRLKYARSEWLASLALFPDTKHYREKELTKFFEYMSAGIPIIASDFPVWRKLIVGGKVGICIDTSDLDKIGAAIDWLRSHPEEALMMSNRGQSLITDGMNWDRQGARLISFYRTLLGEKATVQG